MRLDEFFSTVVTGEEGYFALAHCDQDGTSWREEFFLYPKETSTILEHIKTLSDKNIYFSPYLFHTNNSKKDSAIVGRTIVADLDEANVLTIGIKPNILVESSPNRHQGYWVLDSTLTPEEHEKLSKTITYAIPQCDKTGWFIGKFVRVPNTQNYKYPTLTTVRIVDTSGTEYSPDAFVGLPDVSLTNGVAYDISNEFIKNALKVSTGPQEYFVSIRSKLPPKVVTQYNIEVDDRSQALWALMLAGFRAGLSTEQVFFLARGSANNKFTGLRYHGDRELLKDVLRAKNETYKSNYADIKSKIYDMRRLPGTALEKNTYMSQQIREDMKLKGQFINCIDGTCWFVDSEAGRPIPILARNEILYNFLETSYGLNSSERETHYLVAHLISYVAGLPTNGVLASMSYFDLDTNTLFIHTGRKEVLRVHKSAIDSVTNGYDGIVFPWVGSNEVIRPSYAYSERSWDHILFDNALNNITSITKEHAIVILKVWVIMLLLRNKVISRPILAVFGQPGAGKSTLFRRIYTLLYGRNRSLSAITTPDNFDFSTAADPLVVFDNVDTWDRWLPDRLALAAASSEIVKRKLYTNGETVTLKRQAFIGITAHNPKFGREDVTDRLLLFTLERLTNFTSETDIINYIFSNRGILWGSIINDVQKVLSTPIPTSGYPQFRIEDFSKFGYWIASALRLGSQFHEALTKITSEQKYFSLEEDQLLITAIVNHLKKDKDHSLFKTPSEWFPLLSGSSKDVTTFEKIYKNSVVMGKKFWTLQDSLKTIFTVEWEYDSTKNSRVWRFNEKN